MKEYELISKIRRLPPVPRRAALASLARQLVADFASASRFGPADDEPEGARYVKCSETLVGTFVQFLELVAENE